MALPSSSRSARVSCGRRVNVFASMSDGSGAAFCCAEEAPVISKPANTKAILFGGMDSSLLFVLLYGAGSVERRPVQHNDPRIERTLRSAPRDAARRIPRAQLFGISSCEDVVGANHAAQGGLTASGCTRTISPQS